ncbi:MAG: TOBE domain-containing protein, partial [Chloroflexota bacterium]
RVPVPEKVRPSLEREDRAAGFVIGIRPMDVAVSRLGPQTKSALSGRVDVVEYLGDDVILTVQTPAGIVRALTSVETSGSPGETAHMEFSSHRMHLFAKASGEALF